MELQGDYVIFTRKEKRILGLAGREVRTERLGRLWKDLAEANGDCYRALQARTSESSRIPMFFAAAAGYIDRDACEASRINKERSMLTDLGHSVLAIVQETVPMAPQQSETNP